MTVVVSCKTAMILAEPLSGSIALTCEARTRSALAARVLECVLSQGQCVKSLISGQVEVKSTEAKMSTVNRGEVLKVIVRWLSSKTNVIGCTIPAQRWNVISVATRVGAPGTPVEAKLEILFT